MSGAFSQFELQKAMYAALTQDTVLMDMISGVFDRVPEGSDFPYVTLGEGSGRDWSTATSNGIRLVMALHVFSRGGGRKEAESIMERIHAILHQPSLLLTGHTLVMMRFDSSDISLEKDGLTYHGIIRFRALTESN